MKSIKIITTIFEINLSFRLSESRYDKLCSTLRNDEKYNGISDCTPTLYFDNNNTTDILRIEIDNRIIDNNKAKLLLEGLIYDLKYMIL